MKFKKAYNDGLKKGKKIQNDKFILFYVADILVMRHDYIKLEIEKVFILLLVNTFIDNWEIIKD